MRPRLFHALLLIPLLTASAWSQTTSTTETHGRRTAAQHFADANTTHDGRLTLDQATTGYKSLAKSFNQIDVNHHGYITMDDIKAWKAAKKAAKQAAKHPATGMISPVPIIDRGAAEKPINASTTIPAGGSGGPLPTAPLDGTRS